MHEIAICSSFCETETFRINGVDAEWQHFGDKDDENWWNAPQYGCGDMQFKRHENLSAAMSRYGISQAEAEEICDKLEAGLSFGYCGLCI